MTITPHANPRLSKSRIMAGLQCPKRLWLETYRRELMVYGEASHTAFAQGNAFGELARSLIANTACTPDEAGGLEHSDHLEHSGHSGHLIAAAQDPNQALKDTAQAMTVHSVLFEPAFRYEGVFVRADALIRHDHGDNEPSYTMVEVKAASGVKPQYLRDVAVQTWVLRGCGLNVTRIQLAHVNTDFVYDGHSYDGLLKRVDITAQLEEQLLHVDTWVHDLRQMLRSEHVPDIALGKQCTSPYPCPMLQHCQASAPVLAKPAPEHSVFLIPGIKGKAFARKLQMQGYDDLLAVPTELIGEYAFVQDAHRAGVAWHDTAKANALLSAQPKPWGFLDFETISPAVPLWAGTKPFAHWPFQWSVHMERLQGQQTHHAHSDYVHSDFLDLSGNNPSVACVQRLLAALGTAQTVWAYNAAFERQAIVRMANTLPEYKAALIELADKLQDLIPIVQACYYHPAMQGSYSIKSVLPAIAPELSYQALDGVQDGNAAQGAFFEAVAPECTAERKVQLDTQLRAYCKLDTWAMVMLVNRLLSVPSQV